MYHLLILSILAILSFSTNSEENRAKLILDIQSFDPDLLQIRDAFGVMTSVSPQKTGESKFEILLPIDKPGIRSFNYASNYKQLFLLPGQDLTISFDAKNVAGTYAYGGSLATENVLLESVKQQLENIDYTYLYALSMGMALPYIDSLTTANYQYLNKVISGKHIKPDFTEIVKASILYNGAYLKMMLLERQKEAKNPNHYSFLNHLKIENEDCLEIPYYQWFLDYYISMETNKRFDQLDSIAKATPGVYIDESLKVIANLKNQHVRSFSLAYAINGRLQLEGLKNFDNYYDYFKKHNTNPVHAEVIKKEYERKQLLAPGKPAPQFTLKDVDGRLISLSDFKGKYVFIDFWQTLCPRSRRELPHYLKLHEDYKNENIAFVSISVNEDENVWRNYVKQKKNVGVSLRAEKYFASEVYKSYQVPGLPGFVIIDKEGKIIDPFAAKPSSKEIRETLDQILKSK